MSSAASPIRAVLEGYVAGRIKSDRLIAVLVSAYYGDGGRGKGEGLRPIIEIIERGHPGVVELAGMADGPGFAVRLAERPFPKEYEGDLRKAVEAALAGGITDARTRPPSPIPLPGLLSRLYTAVRRWFTAST
jgi:hypothetical protein